MTQPGIGLRRRVLFLLAAVFLFALVLSGRLAYLQFVRGAELREKAFNVRTREVPVEPRRGVIYDRMGRELAVSVNVDSIFAVPSEVTDPAGTAQKLAPVLGLDYEWVLGRLTQREAFVWIKRKVPDEVSQAVKVMKLPGIGFTQESRRVYPKGSVAAHVLGFAGIDSQGLAGVEYSYDKELRGTRGSIVIEYDAVGHQIPQAMHRYLPPTDGQSLVLTIDEVIQSMVERELDTIVAEHQPKHATILVMDPNNGEILGLGCRPTFDPNHFADYPESSWRNFAISDTYHPGSTFKPVTAAAAVEEGVVSWSDHFHCGGSIVVEDRRIHCHSAGHGSLSLTGVIEYSCNVGFIQIGLRLGTKGFYRYWHAFGLDSETGVDLPGEAVSLIMPEKDCRPVDLAVMAFGQTLTVTPIELARAMAAICNGGYLVTPHVGKELRSPDGQVVTPIEWPLGPQVISNQTSREVSRAMEAVVQTGTGKVAYMPGYRLAGKTGTSQKTVGGVVSSSSFVGSFCGFGPAEDPKVLVLVVVDEPVGAYYGSQVAAPAFGRLMRDIYRYLEIPLVYREGEKVPGRDRESETPSEVTVPNVVGRPVGEALALLQAAGLRGEVAGETAGEVSSQMPGPGAVVAPGTLVLLEGGAGGPSRDLVVVPDVKGRSMAEAALLLERAGLHLKVEGTGVAVTQNPAAGSAVEAGSTVTVEFEPPGDQGQSP